MKTHKHTHTQTHTQTGQNFIMRNSIVVVHDHTHLRRRPSVPAPSRAPTQLKGRPPLPTARTKIKNKNGRSEVSTLERLSALERSLLCQLLDFFLQKKVGSQRPTEAERI